MFTPLTRDECRRLASIWKLRPHGMLALYAETGEAKYGLLDEVREVFASKPLSGDQRDQIRRLGMTLAAVIWLADSKIDEAERNS